MKGQMSLGIFLMGASSAAFLIINLIFWTDAIISYGESPWFSGFLIGLFFGLVPVVITILACSVPSFGSLVAIGVSLVMCAYWIVELVKEAGSIEPLLVYGGLACTVVFLAGGIVNLVYSRRR